MRETMRYVMYHAVVHDPGKCVGHISYANRAYWYKECNGYND